MTDTPEILAADIRNAAAEFNRTLAKCAENTVRATLEIRDGRLHVVKIEREREVEVLYRADENGGGDAE